MVVIDQQSRIWRVGRRWAPWRQRFALPLGAPPHRDPVPGRRTWAIAELVVAGVRQVAWFAELLAMLVVVPFSLGLRVAIRGDWPVQVRRNGVPVWEVAGGDFHASGHLARELREAIAGGTFTPRTPGR
jgi:hypothetical protein